MAEAPERKAWTKTLPHKRWWTEYRRDRARSTRTATGPIFGAREGVGADRSAAGTSV
jgi:hypothetical protein